jgi:acetylornithine/N-succinyldiaminopimelate aminotransferase
VLCQLRELCTRKEILLILDEVQCGIGRSGTLFAFEQAGIQPDAIGMAKGLAGGFPIGAIWANDALSDIFQPGSHGSTFAGNPLAGAAALAVLETIEADNLLEHVRSSSVKWHADLHQLAADFPTAIRQVRGVGFMVGIALHNDPQPIVAALRERGLLTVPAGDNVLRLLPPLIASAEQLAESVSHLRAVLSNPH